MTTLKNIGEDTFTDGVFYSLIHKFLQNSLNTQICLQLEMQENYVVKYLNNKQSLIKLVNLFSL